MATIATRAAATRPSRGRCSPILAAISFSHMLNDMIQSLLPAIYPILKANFHLDFAKIGLITLTTQLTASMLQPLIGLYTDKKPKPYSLPFGMGFTLCGLALLSMASNYAFILIAAGLVGLGSAVFHPESSRVARMASGGQHGLAQSVFQVGGNFGTSLGPLLAAFIVLPRGQHSIVWFTLAALLAIILLANVGRWYKRREALRATRSEPERPSSHPDLSPEARGRFARRADRADVLEVLLSFEPEQLLHVLPDQKFHVAVPERRDASVRVPRRSGGGHDHRRPDRRPHRPQIRDLGLDSRRAAVQPRAAVRESVLDGHSQRHHRHRYSLRRSRPSSCTRRN